MKELFPGDTVRDDFQRWLNAGYGPFMIWQGEKALVTISSLEKTPSVNYLTGYLRHRTTASPGITACCSAVCTTRNTDRCI